MSLLGRVLTRPTRFGGLSDAARLLPNKGVPSATKPGKASGIVRSLELDFPLTT